jgi:hypothetical protein
MRGLVRLACVGGLSCLLAGCLAASLRTAAPIEGTDSRGESLRLSDFRGRVVLLDFWRFG